MPDATITSTASTFGTISGVFSADQSTIVGTVTGIVAGTLTGSVGVPGPAGPAGIGLPAGGTSGQFLQKTSGVDYATDWVTVNLTGLATESWVTAGFYPLTGNPSAFLTASALTPYLTSATAASTYQTLAGMSDYLAKDGNLAGLANTGTARTNLGLGSLAVVNDAPSDGSQYARKNAAWEVVTTTPDYITSVSSPLSVTTGNLSIDLSAYAPLASPAFTGNPTAPTAALGDNDTSLATTAFVQQELASGVAVAKNLEVYVRNQSGSTIPAGRIVYISGATGNKPLITLAQANNDANSAQTMGFTKQSIANNGFGYVIVRGELENIDTSALTEGAQLYLSPTVAGSWTTTKPSAPQHLVYVGIVIRAHPTQGIILVAVQNGYELNELHDVAISSVADNNLLAYESSTTLWKNKTYSALGLLTSATAASTYATILEPSVDGILTVEPSGSNSATVNVNQDANNYIHLRAGAGQIAMIVGGATKWFFNDTYLQFPGGTQQTVAYPGPSGFLLKADNLSGLANAGTARTNLGLGTMATETATNYLTTATASSTYLTQSNAASTYQTISGMSSYLTTSAAASTYQTQAGMSSYLTTSSAASTYAPLASPTFTGTVTIPGGASISGYATTASLSSYAPLASPTFTGTPTLPTGTIATTQSPGNNTTALATTAFVQQEVPAASTTAAGKVELATFDEAILGSSTTLAPTAFSAKAAIMSADWMPVYRFGFTATTSGTGAACTLGFTNTMYQMPSSGSSGHSYARTFGLSQIDQLTNLWGDDANIYVNFAKRIWISGRSLINLPTQANYLCRVSFGKAEASGVGDLSARGLGWKYTCGTSQVVQLMVHNGTTLTTVNSSFTPSGTAFSWDIVSDGNGTVTLYINGSSVATTTAGPSTRATSTQCLYQEEAVLTATSTNSYTRFYCARGAIYVQR